MSAHTKGPWVAHADGAITTSDGIAVIAQVLGSDEVVVSDDQAAADARLIAAAPDHHAVVLELNRLCLVIESAVRHSDPANHAAVVTLILANHAALAKATGVAS